MTSGVREPGKPFGPPGPASSHRFSRLRPRPAGIRQYP